MALNANQIATLKHLGAAGDMVAKAITSGGSDVTAVAGTKAVNTIPVVITLRDKAAQVMVTSLPVSGAGTMTKTSGGSCTLKAGSASKSVWVQPGATDGKIQLDVLNAVAEQNLLVIQTNTGDITMLVLQF